MGATTIAATKLGGVRVALEWKSADLWVGAYYETRGIGEGGRFMRVRHVWLCVLPCLPIHLQWDARKNGAR